MDYKVSATIQKYYDKIFEDGKLVNVRISMWGMSYQLDSSDLDIRELPDIIKLGKKLLIKPEVLQKFKQVESRARSWLYANSFEFPLVPQAHFVPKKSYTEVREKLNSLKSEYDSLTHQFLANYETYKQETLAAYPKFASVLLPHYPLQSELYGRFSFEVVAFEIKLPTAFGQLDIHAEKDRMEAKAEAETKYTEEFQQQLQLHMRKLDEFVIEAVGTLRGKISSHCKAVRDKIATKQLVTAVSSNMLLKQITHFRSMNFFEDQQVSAELDKLEQVLTGDRRFKDDPSAVAELDKALSAVMSEAESAVDTSAISGEYLRKLTL